MIGDKFNRLSIINPAPNNPKIRPVLSFLYLIFISDKTKFIILNLFQINHSSKSSINRIADCTKSAYDCSATKGNP